MVQLIRHKSVRPKTHHCLHGLFIYSIYSNSRAKVLRRPPSPTEEVSMVLLLHMWLNDFPAARDLIHAANKVAGASYTDLTPTRGIIQNHRLQFISFTTIVFFWWGVVDSYTLHPSRFKSQWLATPKDIRRNGFRTSDKLRDVTCCSLLVKFF